MRRAKGVDRALTCAVFVLMASAAHAPSVAADVTQAGTKLRDCPECPEMVVVPAGSFMMGSPGEAGRDDDEGPVHRVAIGYPIAVGVNEVTRGEFARFVEATGRSTGNACRTYEGGEFEERFDRHWRNPGFSQTDEHPVVCVNWNDAQAYVRWLSRETGEWYRLLSESEWEYVARAETGTARYWGEGEEDQCRYANGADREAKRRNSEWTTVDCDDGHYWTSPVGSYEANGFGLRDVLGNVWEWVEDCGSGSYDGAPADGSAWESGDCSERVLRGGSWSDRPGTLRSALRNSGPAGLRDDESGFRVARRIAELEEHAGAPGTRFRDCPECPEMVVVPAGSFMMGSPGEAGRDDDEGPVHRVAIGYPFAVGVNEVTRGEFARFVEATGRSTGNACRTYEGGEFEERFDRHWRNPGFSQTDEHPVVCVNWNDAQAYVRWLSRETGEWYRLLSESEWEYVARAETGTARYWGEGEEDQCRYANGADREAKRRNSEWTTVDCDDGHYWTSPVGSYEANGFGLRDVLGNVWEWVEDCGSGSYDGAPADGSAWESGDCSERVLRGGSWAGTPGNLRSAYRYRASAGYREVDNGFRVARTLTP